MIIGKAFSMGCVIALCDYSRAGAAEGENWTPTPEQIAQLERNLTLPFGARPTTEYARYYWGVTLNGKRSIHGALVYGHKIGTFIRNSPARQERAD